MDDDKAMINVLHEEMAAVRHLAAAVWVDATVGTLVVRVIAYRKTWDLPDTEIRLSLAIDAARRRLRQITGCKTLGVLYPPNVKIQEAMRLSMYLEARYG